MQTFLINPIAYNVRIKFGSIIGSWTVDYLHQLIDNPYCDTAAFVQHIHYIHVLGKSSSCVLQMKKYRRFDFFWKQNRRTVLLF